MEINITGIKLTESQQMIYDACTKRKEKYVMCNLSRQQGKSTVALLLCILWLCQRGEEIIYFTPTYQLAKNFFSKLTKLLPSKLIQKSNSSDLIIETTLDTSIRFFSAKAGQSARGSNCTKLIVDEAAYCQQQIDGQDFYYNIVMPLTKVHCDKILMVSTPFGKSGFYFDLCMQALAGERDDMIYIKRDIYQDALISKKEIEELKKGYPEMAWRCEFLCEFLENALSVFPSFSKCFDLDTFNFSGDLYGGVDLSSIGEDNTVVSLVNPLNQVIQYIIKGSLEYKYKQIAKIINDNDNIRGVYIEENAIGEVMFEEIRKYVNKKNKLHKFLTSNESKKELINRISVLITNDDLHFLKDNRILYSELGTFTYKLTKSGNVTYGATEGAHDDCVMSLGICLQAKEDLKYNGISNMRFAPKILKQVR